MVQRAPQQLRANWARVRENEPACWPEPYSGWLGRESPRRVAEAAALAEDLGDASFAEALAQDALIRARGIDPAAVAIAAPVLAGLAESRGHFRDALNLLKEIETEQVNAALPHASAAAAIRRARIILVQGGPDAAASLLETAKVAAARTRDERLHAVVLAMTGAIAIADGKLTAAQQAFEELRALGDRLGDLPILAEGSANLAKVARQRGNLKSAEKLAASALHFAEISGDNRVRQNALGIAGRIALERGDLDRASHLIRTRLFLTKTIHDVIGELEASIDYASLYTRIGDLKEGERIEAATYARARALGLATFADRQS
jgi:ATP/maltotriose-dependent transcriptional regulator MalT